MIIRDSITLTKCSSCARHCPKPLYSLIQGWAFALGLEASLHLPELSLCGGCALQASASSPGSERRVEKSRELGLSVIWAELHPWEERSQSLPRPLGSLLWRGSQGQSRARQGAGGSGGSRAELLTAGPVPRFVEQYLLCEPARCLEFCPILRRVFPQVDKGESARHRWVTHGLSLSDG